MLDSVGTVSRHQDDEIIALCTASFPTVMSLIEGRAYLKGDFGTPMLILWNANSREGHSKYLVPMIRKPGLQTWSSTDRNCLRLDGKERFVLSYTITVNRLLRKAAWMQNKFSESVVVILNCVLYSAGSQWALRRRRPCTGAME